MDKEIKIIKKNKFDVGDEVRCIDKKSSFFDKAGRILDYYDGDIHVKYFTGECYLEKEINFELLNMTNKTTISEEQKQRIIVGYIKVSEDSISATLDFFFSQIDQILSENIELVGRMKNTAEMKEMDGTKFTRGYEKAVDEVVKIIKT